jgi:cell division protein FtsI/penicillin-binding protein 2
VARRRFGPLVVSVALATAVLLARLGQIQIGQHDVWADEAAALVRVGRVVPYRRGDIRDAAGRVLVEDHATYRMVFAYRGFRREHPLGQVAHALSAIEQRCVPLASAWERMDELALALVRLTPRELELFARGEALDSGPLHAPALPAEPAELRDERHSQRSDLSFYILQLLDLEGREGPELARLLRETPAARELRYVDLAALVRRRERSATVEAIETRLRARLAARRNDLQNLAQLLAVEGPPLPADSGGALANLIALLEGWRAEVEDGAARELFAEASGFEPGRVEARTLLAHLDFTWLCAILRWDGERAAAWLERERATWCERLGLQGRRGNAQTLDALLVEVELAPLEKERARIVLDAWAAPFLAARDRADARLLRTWLTGESRPRAHPLEVLAELDDLFELRLPRGVRPSHSELFSFQDRPALEQGASDSCEVLARAQYWKPGAGPETLAGLQIAVAERARFWRSWRAAFERNELGALRATLEAETVARWTVWEEKFQEVLAREFAGLHESNQGPLELAPGRLDQAGERVRYILRDYGARSVLVVSSPSYELVHLLSRRPESYAGFSVESTHDRELHPPRLGTEAEPRQVFVPSLVGSVRTPRLRDIYEQRDMRKRVQELRRKGERSDGEQIELEGLVGKIRRSDEQYGSDGLEGYFNPELAGRNGYFEERGLQELVEHGTRSTDVAPRDGQPLTLTIDSELQLAALEVFDHPRADPDPAVTDPQWLARPTGALVLMGVTGDVLAMASYPDQKRGEGLSVSDRELERTMRLHSFQPPGSVMKPFAAVWALSKLKLDPGPAVDCVRGKLADGSAGYGVVHCNVFGGHGTGVALHDALKRSCNSYFAWLGDTHYTAQDFLDMYAAFGFGQPTGVRNFGDRYGMREDGWRAGTQPSHASLHTPHSLMLSCNGLGIPQTTVLQVARAYAGLATGMLPDVRIVAAIGEQVLQPSARALEVQPAALDRVRLALFDCANKEQGSAERALSSDKLGFTVAAKTGSADLRSSDFESDERVLKHTWLAAYFPPTQPRYVLVVFCDSTRATASHSAVWLAQQFLQSPTVRAWLERRELGP